MNSLVWMVLDSCRFDSFAAADMPNAQRFASLNGTAIERRYSYASWTAPSHYTFLMGMVPHQNRAGVVASEIYQQEFRHWNTRLGVDGMDFSRFLPQLSLPKVLRELGYRCCARVSLPVLNETTLLSAHFDDYQLMDDHNDFAGMVRDMRFAPDRPSFWFLNLGETHYPYMLQDASLPRISGVHGVLESLDRPEESNAAAFFDPETMQRLRRQQVRCVEHVDSLLPRLFEKCPPDTHLILTADHGELFGEDGFFGHGPIFHEKVFEVPFVEGKVPR